MADRKRQIKTKVSTEEHVVKKRKLDQEMEKIKLCSTVLDEMNAVQTELVEDMNSISNMGELHIKCEQLREINVQCVLLDSMIQNYIDSMLALSGG